MPPRRSRKILVGMGVTGAVATFAVGLFIAEPLVLLPLDRRSLPGFDVGLSAGFGLNTRENLDSDPRYMNERHVRYTSSMVTSPRVRRPVRN